MSYGQAAKKSSSFPSSSSSSPSSSSPSYPSFFLSSFLPSFLSHCIALTGFELTGFLTVLWLKAQHHSYKVLSLLSVSVADCTLCLPQNSVNSPSRSSGSKGRLVGVSLSCVDFISVTDQLLVS